MLSRALGFLREWMVARQIGSGAATDAYYAAFTLPDLLNYLIASSAFEVTLVPVFSAYIAEGREEEAWHVFSTVVTFSIVLLTALTVAGEAFAPHLVRLIVPGFSTVKLGAVVQLTRLMLPAQIFLCLGVVFTSAQIARSRFLVPSLGAAVANGGIVVAGWLLGRGMGVAAFAVGVLTGSVLGFFVLQMIGLKTIGASFSPNFDFRHPGFRAFLRLTIPLMLALSFVVTDDWMLRWFGSFLQPSSITWMAYAKMLARIPMSTVGYAVGLASFPHLAQLHTEGRYDELNQTLNGAVRTLLLFLFPVSAVVVALHSPIARLVFLRTRLRGGDIEATASTLAIFSLGIVGFGIQGLIARGFYAIRDTVTPAVAGTAFTFASIPLYWYFSRRWAHLGLAAASSCVITVFAVVMFGLLAHRTRNSEVRGTARFALKAGLAAALAGIVSYWLAKSWESSTPRAGTWGTAIELFGVSAVGFALYALATKALRLGEVEDEIFVLWPGRSIVRRAKRQPVAYESE